MQAGGKQAARSQIEFSDRLLVDILVSKAGRHKAFSENSMI